MTSWLPENRPAGWMFAANASGWTNNYHGMDGLNILMYQHTINFSLLMNIVSSCVMVMTVMFPPISSVFAFKTASTFFFFLHTLLISYNHSMLVSLHL